MPTELVELEARNVALQVAAERGWRDLEAGRFDDVSDDDLEAFVGQLGIRARTATGPAAGTLP